MTRAKVLSSDLMIMHWNIYNNMVKIHDTILMICMHCAETLVFLKDYLVIHKPSIEQMSVIVRFLVLE